MLLRRLTPIATFGQFGREMERFFNDFFPEGNAANAHVRGFPALNAWEEGDSYFVEAELPGFTMDNIEVEVLGQDVTIKGKRELPARENVKFHRHERGHGEFSRVLTLPAEVNAEHVEATLKDGVLTVKLPKAEVAKARKIQVKPVE